MLHTFPFHRARPLGKSLREQRWSFEPPMLDTSSSIGPGHLEESATALVGALSQSTTMTLLPRQLESPRITVEARVLKLQDHTVALTQVAAAGLFGSQSGSPRNRTLILRASKVTMVPRGLLHHRSSALGFSRLCCSIPLLIVVIVVVFGYPAEVTMVTVILPALALVVMITMAWSLFYSDEA